MARSSRGEDARFSFWKQGFDSPTGYSDRFKKMSGFFIKKDIVRGGAVGSSSGS